MSERWTDDGTVAGTIDQMSIYDLEMTSITGEQVSFEQFRGQVLLIVNVASA